MVLWPTSLRSLCLDQNSGRGMSRHYCTGVEVHMFALCFHKRIWQSSQLAPILIFKFELKRQNILYSVRLFYVEHVKIL